MLIDMIIVMRLTGCCFDEDNDKCYTRGIFKWIMIICLIIIGLLLIGLTSIGLGHLISVLYGTNRCDSFINCAALGGSVMLMSIFIIPITMSIMWPIYIILYCIKNKCIYYVFVSIFAAITVSFAFLGMPLFGFVNGLIFGYNPAVCSFDTFHSLMNGDCWFSGMAFVIYIAIIQSLIALLIFGAYKIRESCKRNNKYKKLQYILHEPL